MEGAEEAENGISLVSPPGPKIGAGGLGGLGLIRTGTQVSAVWPARTCGGLTRKKAGRTARRLRVDRQPGPGGRQPSGCGTAEGRHGAGAA